MTEPKTRAAVPAPRSKSKSFLPDPSSAASLPPADNMKGERLVPMTFNMPRDWHTRFKMTAVSRGINMKELLIESFAAWEREQRNKEKAG